MTKRSNHLYGNPLEELRKIILGLIHTFEEIFAERGYTLIVSHGPLRFLMGIGLKSAAFLVGK